MVWFTTRLMVNPKARTPASSAQKSAGMCAATSWTHATGASGIQGDDGLQGRDGVREVDFKV